MVLNNTALYISYIYEFQFLGSVHYFLVLSDQIKLHGIVSNYMEVLTVTENEVSARCLAISPRLVSSLLVPNAIWNPGFPH